MGRFKKGEPRPAGAGRVRGTPNRTTAAMRDALVQAFERAGGVEYLVRVADEDPRTFCMLLAKLLPSEIRAEVTSSDEIIAAMRAGRERADRGRTRSDTECDGARLRVLA